MQFSSVSIIVIVLVFVMIVAIAFISTPSAIYGGDPSGLVVLRPSGEGPHTHMAELELGSGISTKNDGHRHVVQNYVDDGIEGQGSATPSHTHKITQFIVNTRNRQN